MHPSGSGSNGICIVGEALGATEVDAGEPFVGKAGFTLDKAFKRGGMNRDEFYITNACHCQPPFNKLAGQWYMQDALNHCSKYLDQEILDFKPKVIVGLGAIPLKTLVPECQVGIQNARGYVFWSKKYNCWVINTIHPSFILRGKTAWMQVLIHDLQRSIEIARDGFSYAEVDYTLDCSPSDAHIWVDKFERHWVENQDLFLSCDIETPGKTSGDEEDLDPEANEVVDQTILRCGYSYKEGHALSIPWDGPYRQVHERLLKFNCQHLWWNGSFDIPHINAQHIEIGGTNLDGMIAFHILNSDLKKSLGFVAPFFAKRYPMWKHLNSEQPAHYNACDADVAGINMRGTVELLKKHGMWKVYEEFVLELDPVYSAMTRAGMPVNYAARVKSSKELIRRRDIIRAKLNEIVPDSLKPLSPKEGYKKTPKDTTGLSEVVFNGILNRYCSNCNLLTPKKSHFKPKDGKFCTVCGEKWTKSHLKKHNGECELKQINPCSTATVIEKLEGETRWARVDPFTPSSKGILKFQEFKKHPVIFTGRGVDKKPTTNEKALSKLVGKYPDEEFYTLALEDRELTKVGGTYIGWVEEVEVPDDYILRNGEAWVQDK